MQAMTLGISLLGWLQAAATATIMLWLKASSSCLSANGSNGTFTHPGTTRSDIVDYIEMFYNSKRRHDFNDLLSSVEYEKKFTERLLSV